MLRESGVGGNTVEGIKSSDGSQGSQAPGSPKDLQLLRNPEARSQVGGHSISYKPLLSSMIWFLNKL